MGLMGNVGKWLLGRDTKAKAAKKLRMVNEVKKSVVQALLYQGSEVQWPDKDYETFAREAYMLNVVAYRCVVMIAQAASSVGLCLMQRRRGKDQEIEEHPVLDLLDRPNPDECGSFLTFKAIAYAALMGNSYLERVKLLTDPSSPPKELYSLRPDRMKLLLNQDGTKKEYEYQVGMEKRKFPVDRVTGQSDVLHIKQFHPIDDWYGLAPTEPASRDIDTDNEATTWNMGLLQNQARPGMIFLFKKQGLTDEQYGRLEKKLEVERSGGMNAGRGLILEGEDVDVKPYGWNPTEMDFIEGGHVKMRRVCLAYGVPPMLLGIPGDNTYSNYKEAKLDFVETTVANYVLWYLGMQNNWLLDPKSGLYLAPDWDSVPALEPRRAETWAKAQGADWLTVNEKRVMTGYDEVPDGDVILVSSAVIPLESAVNPPEEEPPVGEPPAEGDEDEEEEE